MGDEKQFADLAFEGGGVKGIGLAGAFAALEAGGFTPKRVGHVRGGDHRGARGGGLRGRGASRGRRRAPLRLVQGQGVGGPPPGRRGLSILLDHGIYEGRGFERWMGDRLAAKGIETGKAPRWPTFGLKLVEPDPKVQIGERISAPRGEGTLGVGTTEFGITPDRSEALYRSGYDAADQFLATWDFPAYIAEFRTEANSWPNAVGS